MRLRFSWPALLWTGAILIISAVPGKYVPQVQDFWAWLGPDKLIHLFLYAGFSLLWLVACRQYSAKNPRFIIGFIVFIGGTVFGILMEWLQFHFISGRNGNIYDAIANTVGLILGWAIFHIFFRQKRKMRKNYN